VSGNIFIPVEISVVYAEVGPNDAIELPLDGVPEPPAEVIFHHEFQDPGSGAFVQVLRVLEDPRDIPIAQWLYFKSSGQVATLHPIAEAWRNRLESEETSILAVYIGILQNRAKMYGIGIKR
jgi:hypothetical protein